MKQIGLLTLKIISIIVFIGSCIGILSVNSTSAQITPPSKNPTSTSSPEVKLPVKSSPDPENKINPSAAPKPPIDETLNRSVTNTSQSQDKPVSTKSKDSDSSNSTIGFATLFLSIINTAGLGMLFFSNKKSNQNISHVHKEIKNLESRLNGDIKSLKSSNISGDNRIAKLDSDNQKSLSDIKRRVEELQHTVTAISQKSSYSPQSDRNLTREINQRQSSFPDRYPSEPTNNQPLYISLYNDRRHNFQDNYQLTSVEREAENYKLSRSAKTEDVILDKQSQGSYWLFIDNGKNFVVPKHTFKIRANDLNDVQFLFECIDYQVNNHSSFTLVEPALLIQQGNGTWQLKEKGKLQFC